MSDDSSGRSAAERLKCNQFPDDPRTGDLVERIQALGHPCGASPSGSSAMANSRSGPMHWARWSPVQSDGSTAAPDEHDVAMKGQEGCAPCTALRHNPCGRAPW